MAFTAGAVFSSEHIKFGLRGCVAASLCYITYNALFWPEISTAVTTCLLTALTTIGASRKKQILRFAGALVGGLVIGLAWELRCSFFPTSIPSAPSPCSSHWSSARRLGSQPRVRDSPISACGGSGFLSDQPAGIQVTDLVGRGQGSRRGHLAGSVRHVAVLRSALGRSSRRRNEKGVHFKLAVARATGQRTPFQKIPE